MDVLEGGVAVVTGSASGLGRAMAERFSEEGMTSVIADRRLTEARDVAKSIVEAGGRAVAMEIDVTKRDSVFALADRVDAELGGASILVNNAAVIPNTPILEVEELAWRWVVDVNLLGVVYGLQAFVPRMLRSGRDCHVVNTASIAGLLSGAAVEKNRIVLGDRTPDTSIWAYGYVVTKAAVITLSELLCGELSGTRVGVSVICPDAHRDTGIHANTARFRPPEYGGGTASLKETDGGPAPRSAEEARGPGRHERDPKEFAERVVRAVREGHFYVFTHPENRQVIEHRFEQMLSGFDDVVAT